MKNNKNDRQQQPEAAVEELDRFERMSRPHPVRVLVEGGRIVPLDQQERQPDYRERRPRFAAMVPRNGSHKADRFGGR